MRNAETILLSRPPTAKLALRGVALEESGWRVELRDYPVWPDWQFLELAPALYVAPWMASGDSRWRPVSHKETSAATRVGLDFAQALIRRLRSDPIAYRATRTELKDLWLSVCLGSFGGATRRGGAFSDIDRLMLATTVLFNFTMLVLPNGGTPGAAPAFAQPDPDQPFVRSLASLRERVRNTVRTCLSNVGVPPHRWIEMVAFGLLMHPHGSTWVGAPINLGPRTGETELERTMEVALGVPDFVYRTANKVHRSYLHVHGFRPERRTRGAKKGSTKRVSNARKKLETRIIDLRAKGVSPRFICQNAEVRKLYRKVWGDSEASITEQTVRRILRKHQA